MSEGNKGNISKEEIPDVELDGKVDGNNDEQQAEHTEHKPIVTEVREKINFLKVKADPQDISPEERKRNVKKLAGAISHSLRSYGEIGVRGFGNAAIGKAVKAIAIASNYIKANGQNLQLECAPAFVMADIGDHKLTGISFMVFASDSTDEEPFDADKVDSVLMVKADSKDVSPDDRKHNVKKLAGAISHSLEENNECVIRCFGNATIGKASKALAIARGYTATRGTDLYCWPMFIVADINGNERTGIAWYTYCS
jgi:stage V sporulation protein S